MTNGRFENVELWISKMTEKHEVHLPFVFIYEKWNVLHSGRCETCGLILSKEEIERAYEEGKTASENLYRLTPQDLDG